MSARDQAAQELATFIENEPSVARELLAARLRQEIWDLIGMEVADFDAGPLFWLTDKDYGTKTEDKHWLAKGTEPVAPFPRKEYFIYVLEAMMEEDKLFIIKSRELMTSWLACAYVAWQTQWFPHIQWVIQTEKEDKVKELVNYCGILYRRQPDWMKTRNPIVAQSLTHIKRLNGSEVIGIPAGENQIRMYHPYGYLMDEAAFLPEAEQCFNAAAPVVKKIIAVSSDNLGWFHNECKI